MEKTEIEEKYMIGPATAGLAQRIREDYKKNEEFEVLKRNYIKPCSTNQY